VALELRDVHARYGPVQALHGVSLTVEDGEIVALLGPNGAGKTTTFELALGLIRPTDGDVEVLGHRPGPRALTRIGAMLQTAGLPEDVTVRELVRLVGRSYPAALPMDAVLARCHLDDRADRTVATLSGGERQRMLLAMALVGVPDLLLLDEPTAALDVASRRLFWERARESAADGATILFATHDLTEAAAVADRVVVLRDGRAIADAPPGALTDGGDEDLEAVFLRLTEEVSAAHPEGARA
jgi:ABC-2 type transport system ATP-binding protein